jgi:O-antigen ligase
MRRNSPQAWADACIILLALYLLKGSDSDTSIVTIIVGTVIFIGLQIPRRLKLRVPQSGLLALVILLMAFGVATPFLGGSNVARFTGSLGRDQTLTGRTEVWAAVLPAREQHPLLGYGLGSFWTDARRNLYDIPTAHNGYLDIMLELGEVGLGLYAVWLLSCTRKFHRAFAQDYDWASLGLCLLIMGLLYNTTESSLNTMTELMTAVVVFTSFVLSHEVIPVANRAKSRAAVASKWEDNAPKWQSWPAATKTKTWHEV